VSIDQRYPPGKGVGEGYLWIGARDISIGIVGTLLGLGHPDAVPERNGERRFRKRRTTQDTKNTKGRMKGWRRELGR